MIVPDVHVTRLVTGQRNGATVVTQVLLKQFGIEQSVPVPEDGVVIVALGTIESSRLALISFPNLPNTNLIGQNFMAHLRSNVTIRIPRSALPPGLPADLESSALFVKGKFEHGPNDFGYFHLQITASGLDKPSTDSESQLFKKIPEVDLLDALRQANDDQVVITIRGIGQMTSRNPGSKVTLSGELDEFGMPRAFVEISLTNRDNNLWNTMDEAADDVAKRTSLRSVRPASRSGQTDLRPSTDRGTIDQAAFCEAPRRPGHNPSRSWNAPDGDGSQ